MNLEVNEDRHGLPRHPNLGEQFERCATLETCRGRATVLYVPKGTLG